MTRSAPAATAAVVSVSTRRRPAGTTSASASASPASPGNGGRAARTSSTTRGVDVTAAHLVAGKCDLRRQGQADLPQRDDDGAHQTAVGRLVELHGLAVPSAPEHRLGGLNDLHPLFQGDHVGLLVTTQQVQEGVELDAQRLLPAKRVLSDVALADPTELLRRRPHHAHLAILEETEIAGERVGLQHPPLSQHPGSTDLCRRDPVDDDVERGAGGQSFRWPAPGPRAPGRPDTGSVRPRWRSRNRRAS